MCLARPFFVEMVLFLVPTLHFLSIDFLMAKPDFFSMKHGLELFPMLLSVFSCAKKVSLPVLSALSEFRR